MHKAKLTSKGQITLPASVRDALGVKPGDKVMFLPGANGEFRVRKVKSIKELYGCLAGFAAPKTNAELDDLVAEDAAEQDEATKSGAHSTSDSEAA